jgi:hypothetical protein
MIHHQVLSKGEFGDLLARCYGPTNLSCFGDPRSKVQVAYDQAIDALVRDRNNYEDLRRAVGKVVAVDPYEIVGGPIRAFLIGMCLPRKFQPWFEGFMDMVKTWEGQK